MTLILEVPDNKEAALNAKAQSQGMSAEQYVQRIVDRDLQEQTTPVSTSPRRHISEVIRERMSKLPDEAWANMPADALGEVDHYVYGSPKREA